MKRIMINDGMFMEESDCWFLTAERSELFCLSGKEKILRFIDKVPQSYNNWRWNNSCIKIRNKVICFPYNGNCIWLYDLELRKWLKLIEREDRKNFFCDQYWLVNDLLLFSVWDEKNIYSIDLNNNKLSCYYSFENDLKDEDIIGAICFVNDKYYMVLWNRPVLYEMSNDFEMKNEYLLSKDGKGYNTCIYNENNIWITGFDKNVIKIDLCSWEKTLIALPHEFGVYVQWDHCNKRTESDKSLIVMTDFNDSEYQLFSKAILANGKIWLIPMFTNLIVYIDICTNRADCFYIDNEEENRRSIRNRIINGKYIFEYFREERYIGLFSIKNEWIIEIDTKCFNYRIKEYSIDLSTYEYLYEMFCNDERMNIKKEEDEYDMECYIADIMGEKNKFQTDIMSLYRKNGYEERI